MIAGLLDPEAATIWAGERSRRLPPDIQAVALRKLRLLNNPKRLEDFLKPMELSQTALARAIGVSPRRINEIILQKRAITADTDLRLARYLGMSEGFFLGLQTDFELMQRRREIGPALKAIKPRAA